MNIRMDLTSNYHVISNYHDDGSSWEVKSIDNPIMHVHRSHNSLRTHLSNIVNMNYDGLRLQFSLNN